MDTDASGGFPARLWLLESFLNSVDAASGQDDLAELDEFSRWLREHDRVSATTNVTGGDLERARQLRGHLRQVLQRHHGDPIDIDARALTRLAQPLETRVVFDASGGTSLQHHGEGAAAFLAEIVATVAQADADGEWQRMKLCPADDCAVAYYDTSKNRSKRWCAMQVCGNRHKTRTYYRRHAARNQAPGQDQHIPIH